MVDPNTRQGKRTPVTLKIKFKSETLEQFIERYAVDVSQGGIFIRTKEPLAVGTQMRFEFQLRDASPLIGGEGTVVWTRENDPSRPAIAPGMGVRFDRLAEGSQGVLERILSEKAKQAPSRPVAEVTKPPMFTDTPTRVAPMPVQEALLGNESGRKRADSFGDQGTPLPRPMPFHSDADDFDEQAFEEATKVRALDELIAESAGHGKASAAAEDLARSRPGRTDATVSDPPPRAETATAVEVPRATVVDRDSAPGLPSPPEPSRPQPRLLDTTPSPRAESPSQGPSFPALAASSSSDAGAKTRLGVEPAKVPVRTPPQPVAKDAVTKPTGMRAVAHESSAKMPAAKSGSSAPLVILLLLLAAAGAAAVWFFVLRDKAEDSVATRPVDTGSGSAEVGSAGSAGMIATGNGSDTGTGSGSGSADMTGSGSAGSASAMTGSGSAAVTPTAELVETVIAASTEKATIEILGTDQKGETPLKAKLEKGKAYKARVQAPGFAMVELDVKGGDPKATAKLVAKPKMITVSSQPPGAVIFVDNQSTGKTTPSTIELTKVQAAKRSVRVGLRKYNYKAVERVVDTSKYTEDASRMIASIEEPLSVQVMTNTNNNNTNNTVKAGSGSAVTPTGSGSAGTTTGSAGTTAGSGSAVKPAGSGSGSAVAPTGAGSGSAVKPPGTGAGSATPPGAGSGSAVKPPVGAGSGSAVKPPVGTGSGSATTPMTPPKPATGTGSATPLRDGPKEPEPDFMKKP